METMSVDYFPALYDQERDFFGSLYSVAGVCGSDRRCDTVVPSGESRGAGWENTAGIAVEIPQARILSVRAYYGTIGVVTAYFLINGQSVAKSAGQNKSDYDKKKFHIAILGKDTKKFGCIPVIRKFKSQIISIILPSALTKVSGWRITTAYTWAEVTG